MYLVKVDGGFELGLDRFCTYFQENTAVSGLRNSRCIGLMLRRGLRWAGDQVESGSERRYAFFLRWLRLVFLIRLAVCGFAVCGSSKRR